MKSGMIFSTIVVSTLSVAIVACNANKPKVTEQNTVRLFVEQAADLKAGEQLSKQGNTQGAAACIACHGMNGEGQAGAGFPRLAGQSRLYLSEQLHHFKEGRRVHPVMMPIAKAMTDAEIENVAAYLASLEEPPFAKSAKMSSKEAQRGRLLAEVGDPNIAVQSCANCHGPGGIGEPPAIPKLRGQFAVYTSAQLMDWKNGTRKTSEDRMGIVAKHLSDEDIKLISAYFEKAPATKK